MIGGAGQGNALWRALGFLGLRRRPVVVSVLLGVCGTLSALGLAALSAWLITRAWQMPPVLFLSVAITAVRGLGISRGVFRYLERLATHDLALGAMASARERVYRALAAGDPGYSVTLRRGELLARTGDDVDEIGNALIRGIIPMAVGAVTSLAAVAIMALVSWWAAIVLAVALVVSGAVAPWLAARGSARVLTDGSVATTRVSEAAVSALWHGPELSVAGRRKAMIDVMAQADRDAAHAADRGMRWQAAAAAATPLSLGVSVLAACLIGIHLAGEVSGSLASVSTGAGLTPMVLGVLILLPLSAFESTAPLTEAGIQMERSRQSAARVMALVDGAGADDEPPVDSGPLDRPVHHDPVTLTVDGLRWSRTDSDATAPSFGGAGGLSRVLPPGARLVVVGPSGSGKSTLLLTLAGLLPPRSGDVTSHDAAGEQVEIRSAVCYFAEESHIFSTTVRENLLLARGDAAEAELFAALDAVGLAGWVRALPDGLDSPVSGGAEAMSGGQRRRLLLARAILHPAPVVLLDEPTEHLDAADAAALLRQIVAGDLFGRNRTVVAVTHQPVAQDLSGLHPEPDILVVDAEQVVG